MELLAVVVTSPPQQGTHDHTLRCKGIEILQLHRRDFFRVNHRDACMRAFCGYNFFFSSTYYRKVEVLGLNRALTTRQAFRSPNNGLNAIAVVIGLHYPGVVKPPPESTENSEDP
jgi:hypothetical protein